MRLPASEPIGLQLSRTARALRRALDEALSQVGGSLPMWLVLVAVKSHHPGAQRELADAVGIESPTLTHHLNRMEADGLVTRERDPENRRTHLVELTDAGEDAFRRLLPVVVGFDAQLHAGLADDEIVALRRALEQLCANVRSGTKPAKS